MANYTLNNEINEIKHFMTEQLPNWENATANVLLEALSKSDNQQIKETAKYIKTSKKSSEMMRLLDFALSMIKNNPTPISESIYDIATDGIRELNQYRINKNCTNQNEKNRADSTNWLWWFIYRIPGKAELKRRGLMY